MINKIERFFKSKKTSPRSEGQLVVMVVSTSTSVSRTASGDCGVDVDVDVTAVGGRAGGDAGSGVNADVTTVGGRAGGGVDVDVTAVGGRADGSAGCGVDVDFTAVGSRAGGDVDAEVDLLVASTSMSPKSVVELVVASTSTSPQSEVELVVMLVVASTPTSPQPEVELVVASTPTTSPQLEGELMVVLVRPSAVMSMLLSAALLLSLKLFQAVLHGSTDYSRRESVAGVDVFRVFCCWQRRGREGGLVPGCGRVCRCQGHRLGKSANHSLEALELVLHPTSAFLALDENVAVCPVQVHDELFQVATVQPGRCLAQQRRDGRHTRPPTVL